MVEWETGRKQPGVSGALGAFFRPQLPSPLAEGVGGERTRPSPGPAHNAQREGPLASRRADPLP
jgi:hypothetical protein